MGSRGQDRGKALAKGSGENINIVNETDVWTYRHREDNEPFVDAINTAARTISDDFRGLMDMVQVVAAAELGGKDKVQTLGYFSELGNTVAINQNYTNIDKMNQVYDEAVRSGYHPPRGGKTGTEAVTLHELGHALTAYAQKKMNSSSFDAAAQRIVREAYKATSGKGGTFKWAGGISEYAQKNYAECIAEAVADYYCNGTKAFPESRAIMKEKRRFRSWQQRKRESHTGSPPVTSMKA